MSTIRTIFGISTGIDRCIILKLFRFIPSFHAISPELLDVPSPNPGPEQLHAEPMAATVRAEVIFQHFGRMIMQAQPPGRFDH